jgi:hypothetical protein
MELKPFKFKEIDRKIIKSFSEMGGVLNFFSNKIILTGAFGGIETVSAVYYLEDKVTITKPFRPKGGDKTFFERIEGNPIVFDKTKSRLIEFIFEDDAESLYKSDVLPVIKFHEPKETKLIFSQNLEYDPIEAESIIKNSPFKNYFKGKFLVSSIMKLVRIKWDLPVMFVLPYDDLSSVFLTVGNSAIFSNWKQINGYNEKQLMDDDKIYYCKTFTPLANIMKGTYKASVFSDKNDQVFLSLKEDDKRIKYYIPLQKHPLFKKNQVLEKLYPNFSLLNFAKKPHQKNQKQI